LPREPFLALIEANRRDQVVTRYQSWSELEGYCALSANPVGHLVLALFGAATPERILRSDDICTALQLVEHCQDVAEDLRRGRVYLPAEDLARHGCSEADLDAAAASPALRAVLSCEAERARDLLGAGVPLVASLRGAARVAVAGFVAGGLATVDALERVQHDVLAHPAPRPRRTRLVRHGVRLLRGAGLARERASGAVATTGRCVRLAAGGDVVVIGGGLAGIRAAIACADAGARVTLLEARPHLGGATWTLRRAGLDLDNGQHVFLRCCTEYRALLARLGVTGCVHLQSRLDVPVAAPEGPTHRLRRHALPRPAHLAPSLLRFAHLGVAERLRVAASARRIGALDLEDPAVDAQSLGAWLCERGESDEAIDRFWDLLIRPTVNLPAREASLALAGKVFQTGLLGEADAADVGWATVPLAQLHAAPASALLRDLGVRVATGTRVERIEPAHAGRRAAVTSAGRIEADALLLAVPHEQAADLLPCDAALDPAALRALGRTAIVNLYVGLDRRVLDEPFLAAVRSPLQWVFDRTDTSGLARGQLLAISLSAADEYLGCSTAALADRFLPELARLLPRTRVAAVTHFSAVREPTATFRQAPGTRRLRPRPGWIGEGLAVAGAWTDTGWPATMEGAVRSGLAAACDVLGGRARSLSSEAA
jgi:squalene-associated FAD-dependent desaturase